MQQPSPFAKARKTKPISKEKRPPLDDKKRRDSYKPNQEDSNELSQQDQSQSFQAYPNFNIQKVHQEIKKMPALQAIFLKNKCQKFRTKILKRFLRVPTPSDNQGHIYAFMDLNKNGAFDQNHLIKIGRTTQRPHIRIDEQIRTDRTKYKEIVIIYTMYNKKLQRLVHLFLDFAREKIQIGGQTRIEWFKFQQRIRQAQIISMINELMQRIHQSVQSFTPSCQKNQMRKRNKEIMQKKPEAMQMEERDINYEKEYIQIQKIPFQFQPLQIIAQFKNQTQFQNQISAGDKIIILCIDQEAYTQIQTIINLNHFIVSKEKGSNEQKKQSVRIVAYPIYQKLGSLMEKIKKRQMLELFINTFFVWENQIKAKGQVDYLIAKTKKASQNLFIKPKIFQRIPSITLIKAYQEQQRSNIIVLDQQIDEYQQAIQQNYHLPNFNTIQCGQLLSAQNQFKRFSKKLTTKYIRKLQINQLQQLQQIIREPIRALCKQIKQQSDLMYQFQQKIVQAIKQKTKQMKQKEANQAKQFVQYWIQTRNLVEQLKSQNSQKKAYIILCKFLEILGISDIQSIAVIKMYFYSIICCKQPNNPFKCFSSRLEQQLNTYCFKQLELKLEQTFLTRFQQKIYQKFKKIILCKDHQYYIQNATLLYKLLISIHQECFKKIKVPSDLYQFLKNNQYALKLDQIQDFMNLVKELTLLQDHKIVLSNQIIYGIVKILFKVIVNLKKDEKFASQVIQFFE